VRPYLSRGDGHVPVRGVLADSFPEGFPRGHSRLADVRGVDRDRDADPHMVVATARLGIKSAPWSLAGSPARRDGARSLLPQLPTREGSPVRGTSSQSLKQGRPRLAIMRASIPGSARATLPPGRRGAVTHLVLLVPAVRFWWPGREAARRRVARCWRVPSGGAGQCGAAG
jgi:hypothetical protein